MINLLGLKQNDFITACISMINIMATILLTFVNIFILQRNIYKATKRDAFEKYYFPLADKLDTICAKFRFAKLQDINFDIFNPDVNDINYKNREDIIMTFYNDFLNFESNLEKGYFNNKINSDILDVKRHMRFMVMIFGRENLKEIDRQKKEYPLPNYEKIVNTINTNGCKIIL